MRKIPIVENIYSEVPSVTTYQHTWPILKIRSGRCQYWYLSLQKARVFHNALDEIQNFITCSGSTAYMTFGKRDTPVLILDNTETTSTKHYQIGLGLHKAKLLIHWLDYVRRFIDSEGQECVPITERIPTCPNMDDDRCMKKDLN